MSVHKRRYKTKDGSINIYYYLAVIKRKSFKTVSKQFNRKEDAASWEREQWVLLTTDPDARSENKITTF